MVTSNPNAILAEGTDWRFLNELKPELKAQVNVAEQCPALGYQPPARAGARHGRCQAGSGRQSRVRPPSQPDRWRQPSGQAASWPVVWPPERNGRRT